MKVLKLLKLKYQQICSFININKSQSKTTQTVYSNWVEPLIIK